jgi:RimJ/RimL family protein N-acetyltransferase
MRYFKKLKGKRIYLSPINIEDVETYTEWLNDLDVTISLGNPGFLYGLEKEKEALEGMIKGGNDFAIITNDDDRLIGNCGLFSVNERHRKAELGIMIGDKNYWDQGYGREAIELVLNYGFNILNLNNIMLNVYSFNKRAIKCYENIGFKEIGRRRETYILGKRKYDEILMDILADEFGHDINELTDIELE